MPGERRRIHELFVLNIALQLFDAVATYQGIRIGWREANPILATAFSYFGVGPALLLFKAKACGLLFLLNRSTEQRIVVPALYLLAGVYCVMSLVPWLLKYATLLLQVI
ncbi:MAG: DUF5658 family protein [Candidatus Binatia bacterium]